MTAITAPADVSASPLPRTESVASSHGGLDALRSLSSVASYLFCALLAYLPFLLVKPGVATPDTKTYLYLDPSRFLSQVAYMWNPTVALGTVTHEYIGYLLPMGPFFVATHALGLPVWVAQRLWIGSILFAAGAGVLYLCKTLNVRGPGRIVAAVAFMLSPYFLQYAGRISVILLCWSGLPWMVALAAQALRKGGWRYPALFALVVALVSGINASSIIYVGVAPVLWMLYAVGVEREATWRQALRAALKIAVLSAIVSLWWIVALGIEAGYGVDVLRYTETVPSTSLTGNASEVIRGLGYWYFYGGDTLGPWTNSAVIFTQWLWLIGASFAVPALAFLAAAFTRWRHRSYFIVLVLVGLILSVGAHPYAHPTPFGGLLKKFMTETTAGLALRSTDRATPLVVLGLAMLLGAGVTALWHRLHIVGGVVGLVVLGLVIANNPAIFNGDFIANNFSQPATLPAYQMAAIKHLNATHPGTRVLAIPGNDFASYRWGNTVDTPQPAFLTRPFVTREQQIMGSLSTADTLYALDGPIQENTENWNALAPMARLISAGDVMVEYDQRYEHYGIPQPEMLALQLATTPQGLSDPTSFGTPVPNISTISTLDEQDLGATANPAVPAPIVTYTVNQPRPITRGESNTGAIIASADATGLQDMAGAGLLNTDSAIYYAGTVATQPARVKKLMAHGAALVVTDTNRKQAFRWDTLTANAGYTEQPSEHPEKTDPSDSPVDLFPKAGIDAHTTAYDVGAVNVTASSYGNTVSFTPEQRPYAALDGNLDTAWESGTFIPNPGGQWWQAHFTNAVTTNQMTLVQPQSGNRSRWITKVTLTFDGGHAATVDLGPNSRAATGQVVTFATTTFHTVRITIDQTSNDQASPAQAAAVGFAEVTVPGQHVTEVLAMPTDLTKAAGAASAANRFTLVMTRDRTSPYPPRSDAETTINRQFTLPTTRTFTLSGLASVSTLIPDDQIDRLLGRPGSDHTGIVAYSSGRLIGSLTSSAASALDGNPKTAWQPGLGAKAQKNSWVEYDMPKPITFSSLNLQVIADGRHSVPTSLTVSSMEGQKVVSSRQVTLPPIADSTVAGAVTTIPLAFAPISGNQIRITFTGIRFEAASSYYSPFPQALPLGIAEVGIPNLVMPNDPPTVPTVCRNNLLTIDGNPVSVEVIGSTASARNNGQLQVEGCGPDANGITLSAGSHVVETALGHNTACITVPADCTGWNLNQLVFDSAPGGGAAPPPAANGQVAATQPGPAPSVHVTMQGPVSLTGAVTGATAPFELVLGQSQNAGWKVTAIPKTSGHGHHSVNLGSSELVDGFANGWPVSASTLRALGTSFTVMMVWTPQQKVWIALVISGLGLVACLVLGYLPVERWLSRRRARRQKRARHAATNRPTPEARTDVDLALDAVPTVAWPLGQSGHRPPWWAVAIIAVITGLVAGGVSAPLVGVAVAVGVAAALIVPVARLVLVLGALGLLIAAGFVVVHGQALHHYPESSDWPGNFESAGVLVWMAVVLLAADAVVESCRRLAHGRPPRPREPNDPLLPSSIEVEAVGDLDPAPASTDPTMENNETETSAPNDPSSDGEEHDGNESDGEESDSEEEPPLVEENDGDGVPSPLPAS